MRSVRKVHAVPGTLAIHDFARVLLRVHAHAQGFDLAAQHGAAAVVHLHRHQARREFDHMRLQSQILERLGRFQAEQSAADHGADV